MGIRVSIKHAVCSLANVHRPGTKKDIYVFARPRGGSTWFAEIVGSQPRMKVIDEPLNFRRDNVAAVGLVDDWADLVCGSALDDRIIAYFNDLHRGRYGFMNPVPFRRNHRFLTDRIVFKVHESEHLIPRVERECNGQIVILLRHPIATTLSRRVFPRVEHYLASESFMSGHLSPAEADFARSVFARGVEFDVGILSWALENLIPFRSEAQHQWLTVSYEELLLEPEKMAGLLASGLDLDDRSAVLRGMFMESTNITMSSETTQRILGDPDRVRRNRRMVTKWFPQVTPEQRARCAEILAAFGLDAYAADEFLPAQRYCHFLDRGLEGTLREEAHSGARHTA